jgi:hypothetical protein
VKVRAILNEILASATEIKCCNRALEGKEIARRAYPAADSLMMWPFPPQMPVWAASIASGTRLIIGLNGVDHTREILRHGNGVRPAFRGRAMFLP